MKRNLILALVVIIALILAYNSFLKIKDFKLNAQTVDGRQVYLDSLKKENEKLKQEFTYKESSQFAELEIRNKLGLAKPGETVVIVPKNSETSDQGPETGNQKPNWLKWKELLLGV
ncbi:septum formation initiator family protein [Candidatus Curtissbacteria bacterium]|nr:septum formation initiator family protein [Candidatus Curtissbacteria bacterium]